MSEPEAARCANPSCGCESTEVESAYCSAYCANLDHHEADETESANSACACGHEACVEAQRVAPSPDEVTTAIGGGPGRGAGEPPSR